MRRIFRAFMDLMRDDGFLGFQNDLALDIYDKLGQGFSSNENEVALVTKLCEITNGNSYGPVYILADKIHGSRSYVEFNYRDKPVTKELGDMAIISIVSDGRERLFQKLCLIQNKKGSHAAGGKNKEKPSWDIDLEQLYLLKNFPRLSGNKGILKNCPDVSFRNVEGGLGAFGLLHNPGDMIFITAQLLTELMKGRKSLSTSDISVIQNSNASSKNGAMGWPVPFLHPLRHPKEWLMMLEELCHCYGELGPLMSPANMPFFGNMPFLRDIYDFVRAWTQINIGETCFSFGEVINAPVDGFANSLLRQIGFGEFVDFPANEMFGDFHWEGELGIAATHIDIGREGKDKRPRKARK